MDEGSGELTIAEGARPQRLGLVYPGWIDLDLGGVIWYRNLGDTA